MALEIANVIAGDHRLPGGSRVHRRENPARIDETLVEYRLSSLADVDDAVSAACARWADWRRTLPMERARILASAARVMRIRREELAALVIREIGKTRAEAEGEVDAAVNLLDLYAGEGARYGGEALGATRPATLLYTERRPLGVCGLITPWNYPVSIPAWKIGPALLCGNTIVWKPSLQHPHSSMAVLACFEEAGLPPGVLNLVHGDGFDVGQAVVDHPLVAAVSFTGSRAVGHRVYADACKRHARASCEMGGKNALVVMADADLERAVRLAIDGGLSFGGQKCTGTDRIIVHRRIAADVLDLLERKVEDLRIGDPARESGVFYGPLVDRPQFDRVATIVRRAVSEGATLVSGGPDPARDDGYYFAPTILAGAAEDSAVAREETFGPVLLVQSVDDLDEAIRLVNATDYGLSASICTNDLAAAHRFVEGVDTGLVYVNRPTSGAEYHAPFGGIKASGLGPTEQGLKVLEFYSHWRTVGMQFE